MFKLYMVYAGVITWIGYTGLQNALAAIGA